MVPLTWHKADVNPSIRKRGISPSLHQSADPPPSPLTLGGGNEQSPACPPALFVFLPIPFYLDWTKERQGTDWGALLPFRRTQVCSCLIMAFVPVAVLTLGAFLSVVLHFSDLPGLLEALKRDRPLQLRYRTLLGSHLSHLLWVVYGLAVWDSDFAIPNILLAAITLGYLWLMHTMTVTQAKASVRYAFAVPIVLLVLWRSMPSWVVGSLAGIVGLSACLPAIRRIKETVQSQNTVERDMPKLALFCLRNLCWVALGLLKHDPCILLSFLIQACITFADFFLALIGRTQQKKGGEVSSYS